MSDDPDPVHARLVELVGAPAGPPTTARDPVNQPMIRHWCDAIGDANPVYTDPEAAAASAHGEVIAPPTMLQAWTMPGLGPRPTAPPGHEDASARLAEILEDAGLGAVVATNCEQTYHRDLRLGDHLTVHAHIEAVSERKSTALGDGYFVTTMQTYVDQHGEEVATMRFRTLRYRPRSADGAGPSQS